MSYWKRYEFQTWDGKHPMIWKLRDHYASERDAMQTAIDCVAQYGVKDFSYRVYDNYKNVTVWFKRL